jgi:hypothetical protein
MNNAINRAMVVVAVLGLGESRAFTAAVHSWGVYTPQAFHLPAAARLGAPTPFSEIADNAVDRAGLLVAPADLVGGATRLAAERGFSCDGTAVDGSA